MKTDFIYRALYADLSDLVAIHQTYLPGNTLATWVIGDQLLVKVANNGEVSGLSLDQARVVIAANTGSLFP